MRLVLGCGLAVVLAAAAGADDKKDTPVDGKKLAGKWEPAEPLQGGTKVVVEFAKDGKMTLTATAGDKTEKLDGTYKVEGAKLTLTMKRGEKDRTEVLDVLKLTDDELVTVDSKGKKDNLKRVK